MWNSILLAGFSAALYGSADFCGGLATRRASVVPVMIFSQLAGLAALLLVLPLLPPASAGIADLMWGALGGCALAGGLTLLYRGLATGKMSVVAPVTAVLAVVVSALAGFAAGDRLSWAGWGGVALALAAIVLVGQDGAPAGAAEGRGAARGLRAALLAGALLGLFLTALKQTAPASGLLPLVPARLSAAAALAVAALFTRPPLRGARSAAWLILAGGALDVCANVFYLLAARLGTLTVAATLTSLYPASTIVLARFFLGERLRGIQVAGLVCAAAGVALIGAG
ncbi:MAG TPA: EamA family transporter [Candidatus Binatia bacterium]